MNIFEDEKLYTPEQVRSIGQFGKTLFESLVSEGILPVVRISPRVRRFKGSTLNRLFSEEKKAG